MDAKARSNLDTEITKDNLEQVLDAFFIELPEGFTGLLKRLDESGTGESECAAQTIRFHLGQIRNTVQKNRADILNTFKHNLDSLIISVERSREVILQRKVNIGVIGATGGIGTETIKCINDSGVFFGKTVELVQAYTAKVLRKDGNIKDGGEDKIYLEGLLKHIPPRLVFTYDEFQNGKMEAQEEIPQLDIFIYAVGEGRKSEGKLYDAGKGAIAIEYKEMEVYIDGERSFFYQNEKDECGKTIKKKYQAEYIPKGNREKILVKDLGFIILIEGNNWEFYDRCIVNENLGFELFLALNNIAPTNGERYILYDQILKQYFKIKISGKGGSEYGIGCVDILNILETFLINGENCQLRFEINTDSWGWKNLNGFSDDVIRNRCLANGSASPNVAASRAGLLQTNKKIIDRIAGSIKDKALKALHIFITNPVGKELAEVIQQKGIPRDQIIAYGGEIDSTRFRRFLKEKIEKNKVQLLDIKGITVGHHNDKMIPLSNSLVLYGKDGRPFICSASKCVEKGFLSPDQYQEIILDTLARGKDITETKGHSGFEFAGFGLIEMIKKLLAGEIVNTLAYRPNPDGSQSFTGGFVRLDPEKLKRGEFSVQPIEIEAMVELADKENHIDLDFSKIKEGKFDNPQALTDWLRKSEKERLKQTIKESKI
jgi:malate/lactate dehydrogenase